METMEMGMALFSTGRIMATPGALDALSASTQSAAEFLHRHMNGDWGELDAHDAAENQFSLENGFRLLSSYIMANGQKLWIVTEADRSLTTILLPEEY
jgi:hypothetical protein